MRATGRSLKDFWRKGYEGDERLFPGEWELLSTAKNGVKCSFPEPAVTGPTQENYVRAEFLRFLALGGDSDNPVHEKGVQLENAYIEGDIDLESCRDVLRLCLMRCHIQGDFNVRDASTRTIDLEGSRVSGGIEARRAAIEGSLYLRFNFCAEGGMDLVDAKIHGSLECHDATFGSRCKVGTPVKEWGTAIFGSRVTITGGVYLHRFRRTRHAAFRTLLGIAIAITPVTYKMLITPDARA